MLVSPARSLRLPLWPFLFWGVVFCNHLNLRSKYSGYQFFYPAVLKRFRFGSLDFNSSLIEYFLRCFVLFDVKTCCFASDRWGLLWRWWRGWSRCIKGPSLPNRSPGDALEWGDFLNQIPVILCKLNFSVLYFNKTVNTSYWCLKGIQFIEMTSESAEYPECLELFFLVGSVSITWKCEWTKLFNRGRWDFCTHELHSYLLKSEVDGRLNMTEFHTPLGAAPITAPV